ncbi:MAG: hypothetical protein CMF71_02300 [Magnetovibrio sp.]|nr:hypothetical protein [Magnetovibrio sp.]
MIADIVLLFHFCIVLFITLGFFLIPIGYKLGWEWVKDRKLRMLHFVMILFVAIEAVLGITCPLTSIEQNLRGINQSKSFVAYWIEQIVYWDLPTQFFLFLYCIFLGWTFLVWRLCPPKKTRSANL